MEYCRSYTITETKEEISQTGNKVCIALFQVKLCSANIYSQLYYEVKL